MRQFTSTELLHMQAAQDSAMQDTCHVLTYDTDADDADAYGLPNRSHMVEVSIECGLKLVSPREAQARGEVPVINAIMRLPIGTEIDERNRIMVTHRYGVELDTPMMFEIEGPVRRGPSGIRLNLRKADNGTVTHAE